MVAGKGWRLGRFGRILACCIIGAGAMPSQKNRGLVRLGLNTRGILGRPITVQQAVGLDTSRGPEAVSAGSVTLEVAAVTPLCEGFAIPLSEPADGYHARPGSSSQASTAEVRVGADLVDTKGVRRKTAPVIKVRGKGSLEKARAALATKEATRRALANLDGDVYAKSACAPRDSRWKTLVGLARGAEEAFAVLPLTRKKLRLFGAALKAGDYRSGHDYLGIAKARHLQKGHLWDSVLQAAMADVKRSLGRGLGEPARAADFDLEELAALGRGRRGAHPGGPCSPVAVGICFTLWLLRGLEGASLLGEQACVGADRTWATLDLGPTKVDTRGRGCRRTLSCACAGPSEHAGEPVALCPVAALEAVIELRAEMGLGAKDPLFPADRGKATTVKGMCAELSALAGLSLTEHSFRRTGAKFYAGRGVTEPHICYLGRWGSAVVRKYIEEAIGNMAVAAAKAATAGSLWNPMALPTIEAGRLAETGALLRAAGASRDAGDACAVEHLLRRAAAVAEATVAKALGEVEERWSLAADARLGAVRPTGREGQGLVHKVLVGDGALPSPLWTTVCGWHFGGARHVRLHGSRTTCAHCLRWADLDGSA